jgi:hypothetical protein
VASTSQQPLHLPAVFSRPGPVFAMSNESVSSACHSAGAIMSPRHSIPLVGSSPTTVATPPPSKYCLQTL